MGNHSSNQMVVDAINSSHDPQPFVELDITIILNWPTWRIRDGSRWMWLNEHVGQQGIDWDWQLRDRSSCQWALTFSKGKEKWATLAAIKWS